MIAAYFRERFRPGIFGPLAVAIAASAGGGVYAVSTFAIDACAAVLLLAEFRLWDDLADRRSDAAAHPERVLVRAGSLRPFGLTFAGLAAANLTWSMARDGWAPAFVLLLLLHSTFALWYAKRGPRTAGGDVLLLAKYPVFVLVIAGSRLAAAPLAIGSAAACLYLAVALYEAWHDPLSPLSALLGGRS